MPDEAEQVGNVPAFDEFEFDQPEEQQLDQGPQPEQDEQIDEEVESDDGSVDNGENAEPPVNQEEPQVLQNAQGKSNKSWTFNEKR